MKKINFIGVLLLLMLIVSACGEKAEGTDDVIELKLGTKMPQDTAEGKGFDIFADLVKEKSGGKLIVKVYPAEQLGKGTTQVDNMLLGTQDMYAEGATYFSDFDPRIEVSSVPFLFRDFDHYQKFNTGEIGQEINEKLISEGVRILNTDRNFIRGPYRVLLTKEPVKTVEDLKGLKLRSFESAFYSAAYSSVGAKPVVVAWTETYLGLKQNLVDGVTSPISLVWPMKFTEVAQNMTVIDEYPQDVVITMNEDRFSKLSEQNQKILIEAANEAGEEATKITLSEVEKHLELMKEEHDIEVFEINRADWTEAFSDYHYQLEEEGKIPEGFVDRIKSIE
ncbi:TRAP transporter substrate-binding protein [Sporosarcina sp. FSL K6-1540]|uniref:TRAP transporter substrate-binding protein n=1 Tax=Sporosarcina sp. FSL K6-1540 TaxID=2921555 RepID=UPI003159FF6C